MPQIDQEFNYAGAIGVASKCRLRVWTTGSPSMTVVVMLTSIPGDSGTSVTNLIQHIATMVNKDIIIPKLGVDHDRVIWIQHNTNKEYDDDPEFDLVTFDWAETPRGQQATNVSWSRVSQALVEGLIKEEIG